VRKLRHLAIALGLIASLFCSTRSYAIDSDTRAVIKTGAYGLLGGAALGAAILPLTDSGARSVFIGASVGLYLGIIVGIYYITHKDDPDVPFRVSQSGSLQLGEEIEPKVIAKMEVPVLRF
jgi:hypothetical protein